MRLTNITMLAAFLLLGLSACSPKLTPFTQKLMDENEWSEDELRQIQFYLSDDIVLRRQASNGNAKIVSGEIKIINGKKVEEIVIKEGTPGVLMFSPRDNRFAVSFESGGDDRYLMFGPNPKSRSRYVLLASDWKRSRGQVSYAGKKYYTPSESAYATLMVDLKRVRKVSVKSRTAKGRTVK